jgi:O-antigen ligase
LAANPNPSPAFGQRYLLAIWGVMAVLTPLVGYLGARGFAPSVGVLGLFCLGFLRPRGRDWIAFGLLALVVAWAGVSMLWSPAPNVQVHSGKDFSRLTVVHLGLQLVLSGAFVLGARRMQPATAKAALRWLGWGLIVLAAFIVGEGVSRAALFQRVQGIIGKTVRPDYAILMVAQGGYALAALIWPVGAALFAEGRRAVALLLGGALVFCALALHGDSLVLALALSGAVFGGVYALGRPGVIAAASACAAYWLLTPLVMHLLQDHGAFAWLHGRLPASWGQRLDIWGFASAHWLDHPLRGWGIDASRAFGQSILLHPHDGALQVWFELGAPGALPCTAFWTVLLLDVGGAGRDRLFAAVACATAAAYLAIGAVSFGLWQEWWICLGALALASCLALKRILIIDR